MVPYSAIQHPIATKRERDDVFFVKFGRGTVGATVDAPTIAFELSRLDVVPTDHRLQSTAAARVARLAFL